MACWLMAPSLNHNQWINRVPETKNSNISIQENASEKVVRKTAANFLKSECVKRGTRLHWGPHFTDMNLQ